MLAAFGLLVWQVTRGEVDGLAQRFDVEQVRRDFARAQRDFAQVQQAPVMHVPHQYEIEHYIRRINHV